jgi:winged helix DNA-binding protein
VARRGPAPGRTLDLRELNRALLARQMLLRRAALPVADAIERLVGQQAQVPGDPYVGLWSRLQRFDPEELGRLVAERRAVRLPFLRSTLHLVTARDALALRPLVQPVLDRNLYVGSPYGRRVKGLSARDLVRAGRAALDEAPRTQAALGARLVERWPDRDGPSLAYAIRALVPVVQIPPRGVWGRTGQPTWATLESWLGRRRFRSSSIADLVRRYLAAFGPASVADAQRWSGLTGLGEVFGALRKRLRVHRDEGGRELFDVPDAPRPDADTPAPVRFLPAYDNVVLGHADRSRIVSDADRKAFPPTSEALGSFLVDGFVRGLWKLARTGRRAVLQVRPARRLNRSEADEVVAEAGRLLAFLAHDAERRDVQVRSAR